MWLISENRCYAIVMCISKFSNKSAKADITIDFSFHVLTPVFER